jgi:hypothetical protein
LESARSGNGYGPNPISYSEIAAWSNLTGRAPRPWEVSALRAMDDTRIALFSAKQGAADDDAPPTSQRELTPALFDALFG